MDFSQIGKDDIYLIYGWYKSGDYKSFFRHFDDFLNLETFISLLGSCGTILMIEDKGMVMVKQYMKPRCCDVSVMVANDHQGNGFGVKAMKDIGKHLFHLGMNRLVCIVSADDQNSVRLLEKGGFKKECTYHQSCYYDGLHDECRYSLTKDEYNKIYGGE